VHGHVGNKSAVFPLQLLGIEVDAIDTVQFSNHTGYGSFKGKVLDADGLWDLIEGLAENGLLVYTHLLTGYMGSAALLKVVIRIAEKLKQINPDLVYVCDPVLGDNGKLYVPEELVGVYKESVVPLANIITPNQFEVEQLTGCVIKTEAEARAPFKAFHDQGVQTVVMTSLEGLDTIDASQIGVLASYKPAGGAAGAKGGYTCSLVVPRVDGSYTGTGDLFAALLLAWMNDTPTQPHTAIEKVVATLQAVITRTLSAANGSTKVGDIELRLIQSKRDIEEPEVKHKAVCTAH